jgi:hypothetical protein
MNQTQSIIVYRNPVEQAFWEGLTNSSAVMPVVFGIVAFFVSFLVLNKVFEATLLLFKVKLWSRGYNRATNVTLLVSAMIGIGTVYLTWI